MKTFSDKLKDRRSELGLTQATLADMTGVSSRSIYAYEAGEKVPRLSTVKALASALNVPAEYLTNDSIESPDNINKDKYIQQAGILYGESGEKDVRALLEENIALFAGGTLSQSEKDTFFEAVMRAYIACKDEKSKR